MRLLLGRLGDRSWYRLKARVLIRRSAPSLDTTTVLALARGSAISNMREKKEMKGKESL